MLGFLPKCGITSITISEPFSNFDAHQYPNHEFPDIGFVLKKEQFTTPIHISSVVGVIYKYPVDIASMKNKTQDLIVQSTPVFQWISYSPMDPRFVGSNPAGAEGFFQSVIILSIKIHIWNLYVGTKF